MRHPWSLPLLMALGSCAPATSDFLEAHGRFADGTALDARLAAQSGSTISLQPSLGMVTALIAAANGPEDLRGLRLEWIPAQVHAGSSYPSASSGPVVFYVERTAPDGGALDLQASVVNGGAVGFTDIRLTATGTLSNLVLARNGVTILTVASGSFSATLP